MKTDFILPDLGEGITECELVEWRVREGDTVAEDQPVADVMTDKALVEITAMHNGVISRLYYGKGDVAGVGKPLFEIDTAEEASTAKPRSDADGITPEQAAAARPPTPTAPAPECGRFRDRETPTAAGKALATPAVRRLARQLDIDLGAVQGSGRKGRVLKEDLLAYRPEQSSKAPADAEATATPTTAAATADRTEPIRGVRAAMARRMQEAASTIPHFTYSEEVDVTALEALRQELKPDFARREVRLSQLALVMKALALAIREHPILNSRVNDDCTELTYLADVNIGMAADTPMGLLVPVVRRVQERSLLEVATEVERLTAQARAGRLAQEDMQGGTISVSNIGALGGTVAAPIISKPEVAIVALGRIQVLPRFAEDGTVAARWIMHVSWSADHRVIDGATMARFCNRWKRYLETPATMLTTLR